MAINEEARLPLWFKVTVDLPEKQVWRDHLGLRLWLYLLSRAKKANRGGKVKFSYAVACRALAWREGRKLVEPSRKAVRSALLRLGRGPESAVMVPDGGQREARGGARGHFVVTIRDYETWYAAATDRGKGLGTGRGTGRGTGAGTGAGTPSTEIENRDRDDDVGGSASPERIALVALKAAHESATCSPTWARFDNLAAADQVMLRLLRVHGSQQVTGDFEVWLRAAVDGGGSTNVWAFIKRYGETPPDARGSEQADIERARQAAAAFDAQYEDRA